MLNAPFAERGARTDEYIHAMRELWGADKPSFDGKFVKFKDTYCRPQPKNKSVPIIVGGHSEATARRAGRLGDGFFPARDAPAELIALARKEAEKAGRDPAKLEITASLPPDLDRIPALAQLGVTRLLVPVTPMAGLKQLINGPETLVSGSTIERCRLISPPRRSAPWCAVGGSPYGAPTAPHGSKHVAQRVDRGDASAPCPSPKPRPATRGFEFGSAAWLHGEQNDAEAGKDRAMPASLPA